MHVGRDFQETGPLAGPARPSFSPVAEGPWSPFPSALSCACACRGGPPPRVLIRLAAEAAGVHAFCPRRQTQPFPSLQQARPCPTSSSSAAAKRLPPLRALCPLHSSLSLPPLETSTRRCTSTHAVSRNPPPFNAVPGQHGMGLAVASAPAACPLPLPPPLYYAFRFPRLLLSLSQTLSMRLPIVPATPAPLPPSDPMERARRCVHRCVATDRKSVV